jgi:phosphoribosylformylglycinamidine cyclo-ligase
MQLPLDATPPGLNEPLAAALLRPTRIYVRALRALHDADLLRGAAHITGGGLVENPTRMLPADARLRLRIHLDAWTVPPIFGLLARGGDVAGAEMLRTFNMGIGMVVCVPGDRAAEAETLLQRADEQVFSIGAVVAADAPDAPVEFVGEVST